MKGERVKIGDIVVRIGFIYFNFNIDSKISTDFDFDASLICIVAIKEYERKTPFIKGIRVGIPIF